MTPKATSSRYRIIRDTLLRSEYANTETVGFATFPVENIQEVIPAQPYSEKGSLELTLEPRMQYEIMYLITTKFETCEVNLGVIPISGGI